MDILSNERTLSWIIALALILFFTIPYLRGWRKRHTDTSAKLDEAKRIGAQEARMQHPIIDLNACIGCGICTRVCPEGEVLGLISGKAVLINGSKCVGHEVCKESCPVGAIEVDLGDVSSREDIPTLSRELESNLPNVFIIGELGGLALIRNAINQGVRVAQTILARGSYSADHPVVVVGAGPAGMACAMELLQNNVPVVLVDQSDAGGTILQYPRRKLVMVQSVHLPGFGKMDQKEYSKERLLEIWEKLLQTHPIDFRSGLQLQQLESTEHGYKVHTSDGTLSASAVVLALGRRGTPRKLNIPGEDLPKVAYKLMDTSDYTGQHILVVGGGDSAVEAAVGLGQQAGNRVTLSYRKPAFTRIKRRNEEQLMQAVSKSWVNVILESEITNITADNVTLTTKDGDLPLQNDHVFIFAGGVPPFGLLQNLGISFGTATIS